MYIYIYIYIYIYNTPSASLRSWLPTLISCIAVVFLLRPVRPRSVGADAMTGS